jgi:hypothetical protein
MTAPRDYRLCLMVLILAVAACDSRRRHGGITGPLPPATSPSLSGQVFDVTPAGRFPLAGSEVRIVVTQQTSPNSSRRIYMATTTGPDGRYSFPELPAGSAVVHAGAPGRRQICGALTALVANTQQDLEVTSTSNPQRPPSPSPFIVTGRIYETTLAGRVGLGGAAIHLEFGYEGYFLTVVADAEGFYQACGISPPMGFEVFRSVSDGYDSECANYVSGRDFGTAPTRDFELKPRKCQ